MIVYDGVEAGEEASDLAECWGPVRHVECIILVEAVQDGVILGLGFFVLLKRLKEKRTVF